MTTDPSTFSMLGWALTWIFILRGTGKALSEFLTQLVADKLRQVIVVTFAVVGGILAAGLFQIDVMAILGAPPRLSSAATIIGSGIILAALTVGLDIGSDIFRGKILAPLAEVVRRE